MKPGSPSTGWSERWRRLAAPGSILLLAGLMPVSLVVFSAGWAQLVEGAKMGPLMMQHAHAFSRVYGWIYLGGLLTAAVLLYRMRLREPLVARRFVVGAFAGALATFALDGWRLLGVVQGWIPMDTPVLFGTIILGPGHREGSVYLVGVLYHLMNGASFGILYAAIWPRHVSIGTALARGVGLLLLIELGMMTLPPMQPMVGAFGHLHAWPQLFLVTLAGHITFGVVLALIIHGMTSSPVAVQKAATQTPEVPS